MFKMLDEMSKLNILLLASLYQTDLILEIFEVTIFVIHSGSARTHLAFFISMYNRFIFH